MIKVKDLLYLAIADRYIVREVHCFATRKTSVFILADSLNEDEFYIDLILDRYVQCFTISPNIPNCLIINVVNEYQYERKD